MYIYLDQNKWIELSRAIYRSDPAYSELISKIIAKIASGEWIFPLSIIHLVETAKRVDDISRRQLERIMGCLSKGYTIVPYMQLNQAECENSVRRLMGLPIIDLHKDAIRRDPLNITGLNSVNMDVLDCLSEANKAKFLECVSENYDLFSMQAEMENKNKIAEEVKNERDEFFHILKNMRQNQLYLIAKTPPENRKHLYNASLISTFKRDFSVLIPTSLNKLDISEEQFLIALQKELKNKTQTVSFLESSPGFNVSNRLMYDIATNPDREIDKNDFFDISFLSVAVPYCDIIITENLWSDRIAYYQLDQKYNTKVSPKLKLLLEL